MDSSYRRCEWINYKKYFIRNKRTNSTKNTLIDKSAFNTDGFDIQGENVHIHDCTIITQDDCIAVKGDSKNMLFERITASGVGLTIGSIGQDNVNNITFKDCIMPNTDKGIYIKFNRGANKKDGGSITNIIYNNITIINPSEYAIWIGPAQQTDGPNICNANPCSLCWPFSPFAKCDAPLFGLFEKIYMKSNIFSRKYIGVLMAPSKLPMINVTFNNVYVKEKNGPLYFSPKKYFCKNIIGKAMNFTYPIPDCF